MMNVASLPVGDALLLERLSPERQRKVLAYKHEGGRRLSLGAGLLLDYALRQHGLCEKAMQYAYGPHGKPEFVAGRRPQLHFNLSHSGDMVACALADSPVGVDIERVSRRIDKALVQRVCSVAEQQLVAADPLAFFDLWTCKEAVVKMTGEGIAGNLAQLDISAAHTWRVPAGYVLSVCTHDVNETKNQPVLLSFDEKSTTFVPITT